MIKILKNTVFGIAFAMTMIVGSEVKADLHEDYRQIEAAIQDRDLRNRNILEANPDVEFEINYWNNSIRLYRKGLPGKSLRRYIEHAPMCAISMLEQRVGISKMTFGELKTLLKNNEYLLSVDEAIAMYMPDVKRDDCEVKACGGYCSSFYGVDIQNNDWVVNTDKTSCSMTKGVMGVYVRPGEIGIFSPSGVIDSKKFEDPTKWMWGVEHRIIK